MHQLRLLVFICILSFYASLHIDSKLPKYQSILDAPTKHPFVGVVPKSLDRKSEIKLLSNVKNNSQLRFSILSLLLPWLYYFASALNIPTLPKFVNAVMNQGNQDVTELSAKVYGDISGIDSFFTFLSVNLIGCLSDYFGRAPFMFLSSFGNQTHFFLDVRQR
jgi:hypothetical protein